MGVFGSRTCRAGHLSKWLDPRLRKIISSVCRVSAARLVILEKMSVKTTTTKRSTRRLTLGVVLELIQSEVCGLTYSIRIPCPREKLAK